ncbi:ADP-ribosylglycohydrolase family protein [Vibrio coralliirubri]|uniref:ADP-ribosylglycohydrolase family protein n=2 Tax=Vibrio coralliirubri TaxID=1516159 RepID=UPI0021C2B85B|nr:ADP-ribosylglycohydrolase family protein [Vibrio coralliirubri]
MIKMTIDNESNIVNSSLWAAYGDALGFITELADKNMLVKRTGKNTVTGLVEWQRKVGGMYGPIVSLPQGAYSDDTQLRLSTARSINLNNYFDINAFSKIEIPVWSSYALGAGIGSKLAAESLGKKSIAWYNNFYQTKKSRYVDSGGNGAAMRIQPHVWASITPKQPESFLLDVVKNSLCTHGHPRAIAGAVFHALCLSYVIVEKEIPCVREARSFSKWIKDIPSYIRSDINLSTAWVPMYEAQSDSFLEESYDNVYQEIQQLLNIVEKWKQTGDFSYTSLVNDLDLSNKAIRGSGTLTAVGALAASYLNREDLPALMVDIANQLGTDTDSIATMVGALRGYIQGSQPPQNVQDQTYLIYDAQRLNRISKNEEKNNFRYPDINTWKTPTSSLDFLGMQDNTPFLPPFGSVDSISDEFRSNSTDSYNYFYQWVRSDFNQSFLVKRRKDSSLKPIDSALLFEEVGTSKQEVGQNKKIDAPSISHRPHLDSQVEIGFHNNGDSVDLDELTSQAIQSNFNEALIGQHLIKVSRELGINSAVAYSAIISKAIVSRDKRKA